MATLHEAFQRSVATARDIQRTTGFLPALNDSRLNIYEVGGWWRVPEPPGIEELLDLQDPADRATRAVVGTALRWLSVGESNPNDRAAIEGAIEFFLESEPIRDIVDPSLLRWELHVAGTADSLQRVLAIGRRFEEVAPTNVHRGLIATTAFLLVHPYSRQNLSPGLFDPLIHSPEWAIQFSSEHQDFFAYLVARMVEQVGDWPWTEPSQLTPEVLEALIDIDATLRRIKMEVKTLTVTQRAIQTWCGFATAAATGDLERLNEAGKIYAALPPYEGATFSLPVPWESATKCFARAANWPEAIDAAKKWILDCPEDSEGHRRLAEFLFKEQRVPESLQAYEAYLRHREEGANDWEHSFLLQLGLQFTNQHQKALALEAAAFSTAFRPQGEAMVAWFSGWFPKLCAKARERWWVGMFTLSSPVVETEIGEARWDQVADCFGEAVAFELKERVFGPFAAAYPNLPRPDDHWKRVLAAKGTLGEMIQCMLQTRQVQSSAAKHLGEWMSVNHPRLREQVLTTPQNRLFSVTSLRAQAQHGTVSVTEAETKELFLVASNLLQAMAG